MNLLSQSNIPPHTIFLILFYSLFLLAKYNISFVFDIIIPLKHETFSPFICWVNDISFVSFSQNIFTTQKCQNMTNDRTRKACIIKEIQAYVDANYDIKSIIPYAKPGPNRVYVRFKIDAAGKITDIQAKSTAFELELAAIEVLRSFDALVPVKKSKNKDTEISITDETYTLPIVFTVQKTQLILSAENKRITGN